MSDTAELIRHLICDSNCAVCHEAAGRLKQLAASNAELLAACQSVIGWIYAWEKPCEWGNIVMQVKDAIAHATASTSSEGK